MCTCSSSMGGVLPLSAAPAARPCAGSGGPWPGGCEGAQASRPSRRSSCSSRMFCTCKPSRSMWSAPQARMLLLHAHDISAEQLCACTGFACSIKVRSTGGNSVASFLAKVRGYFRVSFTLYPSKEFPYHEPAHLQEVRLQQLDARLQVCRLRRRRRADGAAGAPVVRRARVSARRGPRRVGGRAGGGLLGRRCAAAGYAQLAGPQRIAAAPTLRRARCAKKENTS